MRGESSYFERCQGLDLFDDIAHFPIDGTSLDQLFLLDTFEDVRNNLLGELRQNSIDNDQRGQQLKCSLS